MSLAVARPEDSPLARWLHHRLQLLTDPAVGGMLAMMVVVILVCGVASVGQSPQNFPTSVTMQLTLPAEDEPSQPAGGQVTVKIDQADLDRMLTGTFLMFSIVGATGGAFIKIILLPPSLKRQDEAIRTLTAKLYEAIGTSNLGLVDHLSRELSETQNRRRIDQVRQLAAEFLAALMAGFVLTPMAMFYMPIMPVHSAAALSVSACVAICSTLIIHAIFRYVDSKLPKDSGG